MKIKILALFFCCVISGMAFTTMSYANNNAGHNTLISGVQGGQSWTTVKTEKFGSGQRFAVDPNFSMFLQTGIYSNSEDTVYFDLTRNTELLSQYKAYIKIEYTDVNGQSKVATYETTVYPNSQKIEARYHIPKMNYYNSEITVTVVMTKQN